MVKQRGNFFCQECGARFLRWQGRCHSCGAWDCVVEEKTTPSRRRRRAAAPVETPVLSEIDPRDASARLRTGMPEFDRVLGGGIVPDSVVLIAGDPGVGKSTLLLQIAERAGKSGKEVLYVAGEESPRQLKLRSSRLGLSGEGIRILDSADVEAVVSACEQLHPSVVIADSAQALHVPELGSSPGTVGQVREAVGRLAESAKTLSHALFVVSHVTKEGLVAGPKVVEHLVDVVLMLEGDNKYDFRLLRALKNRFGPTGELGVFEMENSGLIEVERFDLLFRPDGGALGPGAATALVCEGSRPLLVEVQALVTRSPYQMPNRRVTGLDHNRVSLHLALLGKLGLSLGGEDVFVNVAGGLRLTEPAGDLATLMAIASSKAEVPLPHQVGFAGEVGLRGELRAVPNFQGRLREAAQYGLTRVVAPHGNEKTEPPGELQVDYFAELGEVLENFFSEEKRKPVAGQ